MAFDSSNRGSIARTQELDLAGDYGCAIYADIMPPGGTTPDQAAPDKRCLMKPPTIGKRLLRFRFTRRRKEKRVFDTEDGGMTVCLCCRYENQKGETGQRRLLASVIIP